MREAGMRLAGSTSSALSHAVIAVTAASTATPVFQRAARFSANIFIRSRIEGEVGMRSPAEIDAEHPLRELWSGVLLPAAEVAATVAAEEHRLGLETRILRPRHQVAPRDRDHR